NDVVIVDPGISRHHAVVTVDDASLTISDNQSTNGITIDGELIGGPVAIPSGKQVMLGHSWLSIIHHPPFDSTVESKAVDFRPSERTLHRFYEQTILLPSPPDPATKRRRGDFLSTGRIDYPAAVEAFVAAVESADFRMRERQQMEVTSRLYEAPSIQQVLAGVDDKVRLWERQALDADGLEVRIGLSRMPSRTTVQVPVGGEAETRAVLATIPERYRMVDKVPAVADLRRLGSLGLIGENEAVDPLAYSLIAQLVWFHGPEQLGLAYRPRSRTEAWDWLKWLPHLDFAGSHNGVSDTDFVGWVSALLDGAPPSAVITGAVEERRSRPSAIVILLDDETSLPSALLARLIQEGPALGLYTLLLGAAQPDVGVPMGATITVGEETATMAGVTPEPIVGIPVETIDLNTAACLARRLTPIRCPATGIGAKLGVTGGMASGDGVIVGPFRLGMTHAMAAAVATAPAAPAMPQHPKDVRPQRDLKTMPHGDDDARLVLGTVDVPGRSDPAVFACNLARDGSLCLSGPRGSGKTSALRSVAGAAAMVRVDPGMIPITYYLDVQGDLEGLSVLPHSLGAARNDIDGFRSVTTDLERLIADRTAGFAQAGVDTFDDYRRIAPQSALRRVLILIDEIDAFVALMDSLQPGRADALLGRLVEHGSRLGLHLVFSAKSRDVVPPAAAANVGRWLELGGADRGPAIQPGTAAIGQNLVRFATVGGGRAAHRALVELAGQLVERGVTPVGG
ncbi:MAG: FHA domain-containing protein, partial [Acidimicrobiales bacterium]